MTNITVLSGISAQSEVMHDAAMHAAYQDDHQVLPGFNTPSGAYEWLRDTVEGTLDPGNTPHILVVGDMPKAELSEFKASVPQVINTLSGSLIQDYKRRAAASHGRVAPDTTEIKVSPDEQGFPDHIDRILYASSRILTERGLSIAAVFVTEHSHGIHERNDGLSEIVNPGHLTAAGLSVIIRQLAISKQNVDYCRQHAPYPAPAF